MDAGGGIRGSLGVLKTVVFPILPILVKIPGDLSELMPNLLESIRIIFVKIHAQSDVHKKYNRL